MITFDDGTVITFAEAAEQIESEGAIFQTFGYGNQAGERCSLGVLFGWTPSFHRDYVDLSAEGFSNLASDIIKASEGFEGTPQERCRFMTEWFLTLEVPL